MSPRVLNKYKDQLPRDAIYIGRPSKWGNPFVLENDRDREAIYKQYCEWLDLNEPLKDMARRELKGKDLVCYCAPKRCHGDRLIEIANEPNLVGKVFGSLTVTGQDNDGCTCNCLCGRGEIVPADDLISGSIKSCKSCRYEDAQPGPLVIDNLPAFDVSPLNDGITHINVYSKGRTKLGRSLSNFAPIKFVHPKYGEFHSVEAFWYWRGTGMQHDYLRYLSGFDAKQNGKQHKKIIDPDFLKDVEEAIRLKIEQNSELKEAFIASTLPFHHYYLYGTGPTAKVVYSPETIWTNYFLTRLRAKMSGLNNGIDLKVIVAGTRDITDYALIEAGLNGCTFNIGEVISGTAKGPDSLAIEYAGKRNIPVKLFPADWDKYGKSAGYRRNVEMAEYADVLVAFWDGESKGTKHMIDIMTSKGKTVVVIMVEKKKVSSV